MFGFTLGMREPFEIKGSCDALCAPYFFEMSLYNLEYHKIKWQIDEKLLKTAVF